MNFIKEFLFFTDIFGVENDEDDKISSWTILIFLWDADSKLS